MVNKSASQILRECHGASRLRPDDTTIALPAAARGLGDFQVLHKSETKVTLSTSVGAPVEVEILKDCGVAIEVRYDQADATPIRQEVTGRQNQIARSPVTTEEKSDSLSISSGDYGITLNKESGELSVLYQGRRLLCSDGPAFQRNTSPVRIHERLESTVPVPNERVYKPALDLGYFHSLGVTFQYERPSGVVLGLPGATGEMNRNGYRFQLYNSDNSRHVPNRQPLYQSWPVLFHRSAEGDGWVGVFHDNPSRTFVDIGELYPEEVRFESLTGNSRVYVVGGESLEEVSSKMVTLLGTPNRLPLFCFGYQQSRWSFFDAAEVRAVVDRFQENKIPLDAIYLDIDYMDGYRVFTVNNEAFSDMPGLVDELHDRGVHTVAIINPGVKIDPGYPIFDDLVRSDNALKTASGEPFTAEAWAGACLLPDFFSPKAQEWWRQHVSAWIRETQLDGVWNDMNEPTNWRGKNDATCEAVSAEGPVFERYNHYGLHMAAATQQGFQEARPDSRPFNISRSGYPGIQQHAVIWHGDNSAWWEHLQMALDMSVSYSLAGAFYTGPDVPGFGQNAPDDLAVRFFQLGAFLPFFRGHRHLLSKPNEPFDYGKEANQSIREAIHLRYSLLREWVTGFEMAIREGKSPLLPTFSPEGQLMKDQFLLFDSLLVAPVLTRDQSARLIALPEGTWYRLGETDKPIQGGRYIIEPVTLSSIPVFVRAGRILTRNKVGSTAAETLSQPEDIEVYPLADGTAKGYWYNNDGKSGQSDTGNLQELYVDRPGATPKRRTVM